MCIWYLLFLFYLWKLSNLVFLSYVPVGCVLTKEMSKSQSTISLIFLPDNVSNESAAAWIWKVLFAGELCSKTGFQSSQE